MTEPANLNLKPNTQDPASPAGGQTSTKETEPKISSEAAEVREGIREMEKPPEIPEEVEKAGVKKVDEFIIPPTLTQMGVKPTGPSTPLPTTTTVVLPLSDDQVLAGAQTKNPTLSLWALAIWCLRQLKKAHVVLSKIGNRIVRTRQ